MDIKITFPDGSQRTYKAGITPLQIAEGIAAGLARSAVAAVFDGEPVDLTRPLHSDGRLKILTFDDPKGKEVFWHSTAHIMASAVLDLFPNAKLAIGPAIDDGFYYDFDVETPFTPEDLAAIEAKMAEIINADLPFEHREVSKQEAREDYRKRGEIYKVELLDEIPDDQVVTIYKHGDFSDLCRGPHLRSTGMVKAFKLLSNAGAYWRGSERNKMLQRIYGISFPKKSLLDEHLACLLEAKRRDHRVLGKQLDYFSIWPEVGGGLVLWHPKGAFVRHLMEEHWKAEHLKGGYQLVYSPHIARRELWDRSGHTDFYSENMYSPIEVEGAQYQLKPMNCPFHMMMYKSQVHSYRELPLRWAELGTVYRYERGGTMHGLFRVRGFTQDDAHLFCAPEQMPEEIGRVFEFSTRILKDFGFDDLVIYLSTRPEKFVGDPKHWDEATAALKEALDASGRNYEINEGDGAFYGPKIDINIRDCLGRLWQCSTIQFDFNLPERFDLTYAADDGSLRRPYVIHRTLLGSLERFFGVLLEHYVGALPVWLSPIQAVVLPIADAQHEYARTVKRRLEESHLRVEIDERSEKIGYKVRDWETRKIPYMLIAGKKEVESGLVAVRIHGKGEVGTRQIDEVAAEMARLDAEKSCTY